MKFTFLLFILYLKLKKAAKKDPEFQEYIKKEKTKVLIKTADGKRGRMFIFDNGKFSSVPGGDQKQFDVAMIWKDAKYLGCGRANWTISCNYWSGTKTYDCTVPNMDGCYSQQVRPRSRDAEACK